jgi:hypothetical protein
VLPAGHTSCARSLWLTAGLTVLIDRPRWHDNGLVSLYVFGLVIVVLAWSTGRQRLAGMIGLACTVALVVAHRPDFHIRVSIGQPILPMSGYLIMAIAPTRKRPSAVAVAALAALVLASVIVPGANLGGLSQLILLSTASIAGLLIFPVQPRLAIASAITWTAVGIELMASAETAPARLMLLLAAAPAVLAATTVRAKMIRRGAS